MLFDAHTRCLIGPLGGVAGRGIYDNMKTAVDRPRRGSPWPRHHARFAAMASHYLFEPDFCNVASGWEKGRVEKGVQDARRRDLAGGRARARRQLCRAQCLAGDAVPRGVGRTATRSSPGLTIRAAWAARGPYLIPMPTPFDGYVEVPARVSSTSLVSVARNRYSVPCAWAGHRVSVRTLS